MTYANRIERLEAALMPERELRVCVLFNMAVEDEDAAIARWRVNHAWPDDGRHPLSVLRVRWLSTSDGTRFDQSVTGE